jgi:putative endopeptidase
MKKRISLIIFLFTTIGFTLSVIGQSEINRSLEFDYMDLSVLPKDDFYQFANGNWMKNNPIPEEESRWSSFNVLADQNITTLNKILLKAVESPGDKGSANQLIGDYYYSFIDTISRNEKRVEPILEYLTLIESIKNTEDLQNVIISLQNIGISNLFHLYVAQDKKNNELYRVHLYQGGLGLPNRDYYFKEDERSVHIREKYNEFIDLMFERDKIENKANRDNVYTIEKQLAESSKSPVELRDIEKQYNPMTVDQLQILCPMISWSRFFNDRGLNNVDTLIVGQPNFFVKINALFNSVSIKDWKSYLKWKLIRSTAGLLSMDYSRMSFYFNSTVLRGTKKMKPLWKRGVKAVTSSAIGEALGQAFVKQNFSESAKIKVNAMVALMLHQLQKMLQL